MWASSMALNGLCGSGKPGPWTCHPIEHELSAFYDYAVNVWHLDSNKNKFELANEGIDLTEKFFKDCGIPMTLKEVNIDETHFDEMAKGAVKHGALEYAYVPLNEEDVKKILEMCL